MSKREFLSAEQLGITEGVREAFVAVHQELLLGEIPEERFTMRAVGNPNWKKRKEAGWCGTPGCIFGWAVAYAQDSDCCTKDDLVCAVNRNPITNGFDRLCNYSLPTTTAQAAQALGNVLLGGGPNWAEDGPASSPIVT